MALRPTSDYTHFCEVIPDDYQEYAPSHNRLHRDGSKELLILTEGRKAHLKSGHEKSRWGCCIWCGQLMCMCCALMIRRNAVRCISLVIASVVLMTLLVFTSISFIKQLEILFFNK